MEELKYVNDPEVQKFIQEHGNDDVSELALKARRYPDLPMGFIIDQIHALQKVKTKIPSFFEAEGLIYPPKLNLEQSSSELTARYKAKLLSGRVIDLTGGFGIDSCFMSREVESLIHCERNEKLSQLVEHNFKKLGLHNVQFAQGDSLLTFQQASEIDAVFVDPARRDGANRKVYRFQDCEPNLTEFQDTLFEKVSHCLVKASPIIDLKQGLSELKFVKEIHVVSVNNECKEVLFLQQKGFEGQVNVKCVELQRDYPTLGFTFEEEVNVDVDYEEPLSYLYEANSSINKAGGFNSVVKHFGVKKLHPNSHLYTSLELVNDFPGRKFKNEKVLSYSKKDILKELPEKKANITVRNFKSSVAEIRKKLSIKEGGDKYLFATTGTNNKPVVILCSRV